MNIEPRPNLDRQSSIYFCSRLGLYEQPDLSIDETIYTLYLSSNSIQTLYSELLPPNIKYLNMSYNYLSNNLPSVWPDTIEILNLEYNYIQSTDAVHHWPNVLRELLLNGTLLSNIPKYLPQSLEILSLTYCNLVTLRFLPHKLKTLRVSYNRLKNVELLPRELQYAYMSENRIESNFIFKYRLPQSLKIIHLDSNCLTWLPPTFPDTLEILNVSNNLITEFSSVIPLNLKLLLLDNNKIRTFRPICKKQSTVKFSLYIRNNCITDSLVFFLNNPCLELIYETDNWNKVEHTIAVIKIQIIFKKYKLKKGIRTWARVVKFYNELIKTAMHPDRIGKFEELPKWA
jgi:hypothetical protein